MKLYIEKRWGTRHYALYDLDKPDEGPFGNLVALFAYRTGAEYVKKLLEVMEREIGELKRKKERG